MSSDTSLTPKQKSVIWRFCTLYGNVRPMSELGQKEAEGLITRQSISPLIGAILGLKFKKGSDWVKAAYGIEAIIRTWAPGFSIKAGARPPRAKGGDEEAPKGEPKEERGEEDSEEEEEDKKESEEGDGGDEVKKKLKEIEAILKRQAEAGKREAIREAEERARIEAEKFKKEGFKGIEVKDASFIKPSWFDKVAHYVAVARLEGCHNLRPFLVGPRGCGKSRAMREIASALGFEHFVSISFGGGMRYDKAFGGLRIRGGDTVYEPGVVLKAFIQENTLIFIDEALSGDEDVTIGLNCFLDEPFELLGPDGISYRVGKGSVVCAAANSTGRQVSRQYTGAKVQDSSLLDRFVQIVVGYDPEVEAELISKFGASLSAEDKTYIARNLADLRAKLKTDGSITYDASTRKLIVCVLATASGIKVEEAFVDAFLNPLSKVERAKLGF